MGLIRIPNIMKQRVPIIDMYVASALVRLIVTL